jgi:hypothetical protein
MEHFVEDLNESDVEDVEDRTNTEITTPITWFGG